MIGKQISTVQTVLQGFLLRLDQFNVCISGWREKGLAHCAELWLSLLICVHLGMDQQACSSSCSKTMFLLHCISLHMQIADAYHLKRNSWIGQRGGKEKYYQNQDQIGNEFIRYICEVRGLLNKGERILTPIPFIHLTF